MNTGELVLELHRLGVEVPASTLRRWAHKGLIPGPKAEGKKGTRGCFYSWPQETVRHAAAVYTILHPNGSEDKEFKKPRGLKDAKQVVDHFYKIIEESRKIKDFDAFGKFNEILKPIVLQGKWADYTHYTLGDFELNEIVAKWIVTLERVHYWDYFFIDSLFKPGKVIFRWNKWIDREPHATTGKIRESVKLFYNGPIFSESEHYDVELREGDPLGTTGLSAGWQTGRNSYPGPEKLTIAGYEMDNDTEKQIYEILRAHGLDPLKTYRHSIEWRKALHELAMTKSTVPLHFDPDTKMPRITKFIPVNYRGKAYPAGISCSIEEVAGHMDKTSIDVSGPYSLHTEYSYGPRKLISPILQRHPILKDTNKNGVPQLWKNEAWSLNFFEFIQALIGDNAPPEVIEIHPPFDDYCFSIDNFLDIYETFEKSILGAYPSTVVCIENRAGTAYRGGKFLISKLDSVAQLCEGIHDRELGLRLALDYPQLFTAEHYDLELFPIDRFIEHHGILEQHRPLISSIHIWGKTKRANSGWIAHHGDLNSLFNNDFLAKRNFLDYLIGFYDDDKPRYFVPEVNTSANNLQSIVNDFIDAGADFS